MDQTTDGDRATKTMPLRVLVSHGSYRSDREGIRLAQHIRDEFRLRGDVAELIDAKAVGMPIMDRMYKEFPPGEAPAEMEGLAAKIRQADAFVFIVGELNWGVQLGLKNLTDHFLEEWLGRPGAIASYSTGRTAGVRAAPHGGRPFPKWAWLSHRALGRGSVDFTQPRRFIRLTVPSARPSPRQMGRAPSPWTLR